MIINLAMEVRFWEDKDGADISGDEENWYPREESDTDRENEGGTELDSPLQSARVEVKAEEKEKVVITRGGEEEKEVPESMKCGLCLQILLDPTSLPCGHTFCQVCLIMMRMSRPHQPSTLCPMCRKPWTTIPAINVLFR